MPSSANIFATSSRKPEINIAQALSEVQKKYNVSMLRQMADIMRLQRNGLTPYEYFYYGLFDPKLDMEEKKTYLGDERTRAIYLLANKLTWWDAAEDKLLFHALMTGNGFPVPELHAVAHPTRRLKGTEHLSDAHALGKWLSAQTGSIFGKPVLSSHGEGAVEIASVDAGAQTFLKSRQEEHSLNALVEAIEPYLQSNGYIFQQTLRPHPVIGEMTGGYLSTLRIIVAVDQAGPQVRHIICRLPSGGNSVDNFRRPGNIIASVDPQTGKFGRATRGVGLRQEVLESHPDSGVEFSNFVYPRLGEAIDLALEASQMFCHLHIQSWDVAVCDDGIYALEMNPGGNFNLVQLVMGRGAYTLELREFIRWCETLPLNSHDKARRKAVQLVA